MKTVAQTVIEADRFYTIAARTGSVIEAVESAKNEGSIRLGKYDHKPEQEWSFVRVGDGVYRIRIRASGKLIEDVGGTSQMWTVEPTPAGTVRLRSSWASGKCIDTVGMGVADGAQLQIWQETAGEDQLWTIAEVKDRAKRVAKATKEEEPAAAPVEKVEEKPVEAAPVKAEPVVEAAKAEEKPAEPAPAKVEAPAAEAPKAEEAKPEVKAEPAKAAPAAKAPAKKPTTKKTSRAARKKAAAKK